MTEYIFEKHEHQDELIRLRLIEQALDATTIAILKRTGIGAGWRCLELGAGAGSAMKWMATVVGDNGSVVGIDKNAIHLRDLPKPCEVVAGDFLEVAVEAGFDLAHSGARALKPGGRVFFVDSLLDQVSTAQDSPPLHREGYAERKLNDGRQFRIVKMFYEPAKLEARLQELNWYGTVGATQRFFLYGLVRQLSAGHNHGGF